MLAKDKFHTKHSLCGQSILSFFAGTESPRTLQISLNMTARSRQKSQRAGTEACAVMPGVAFWHLSKDFSWIPAAPPPSPPVGKGEHNTEKVEVEDAAEKEEKVVVAAAVADGGGDPFTRKEDEANGSRGNGRHRWKRYIPHIIQPADVAEAAADGVNATCLLCGTRAGRNPNNDSGSESDDDDQDKVCQTLVPYK